jgi:hypothetical protein
MAKETEKIKESVNIESEKFYLTEKIRSTGYRNYSPNKGFNILIDFERDFNGNRISRYASTGKMVNGEFQSDKLDYLTGLNSEQVYQLAIAKVIKIKKDQRHYFVNHLKSIQRIVEDE